MNQKNKFPYKWYLKDNYPVQGIKNNNLKVFSTFACGGGSSMGYKLAGFDVIGANDIDPKMAKVYKENHKPKHFFECPIKDLLKKELPKELYNLDILDGSPPCSTFSMAGQREKGWKKKKYFREGQTKQVLSDLFFDYIDLVNKLKPKVFIAENVKGMIIGNGKAYTKIILKKFEEIGYNTQLFLLNAGSMGVPQKRERVFFIGQRKDFSNIKLKMEFNKKTILFREIKENIKNLKDITETEYNIWKKRKKNEYSLADTLVKMGKKYNRFTTRYIFDNKIPYTITAGDNNILFSEPRHMTNKERSLSSSFPLDYNFLDIKPKYLMVMSVPPVIMAQIANQVYEQIFKKADNKPQS